jgi:hypothetical protein
VEFDKKCFSEIVVLLAHPSDVCNYAGISVQEFTDLLMGVAKYVAVESSLSHIVNHQVTAALIVIPHQHLTALNQFLAAQSTLSITLVEWPGKSPLSVYVALTQLITEALSGGGMPMPPQLHEPIALYSFGKTPES